MIAPGLLVAAGMLERAIRKSESAEAIEALTVVYRQIMAAVLEEQRQARAERDLGRKVVP